MLNPKMTYSVETPSVLKYRVVSSFLLSIYFEETIIQVLTHYETVK